MAQRKTIMIDGEYRVVSPEARLSDVAPSSAQSVITTDGQVISLDEFARHPAPDGFETNLNAVIKG